MLSACFGSYLLLLHPLYLDGPKIGYCRLHLAFLWFGILCSSTVKRLGWSSLSSSSSHFLVLFTGIVDKLCRALCGSGRIRLLWSRPVVLHSWFMKTAMPAPAMPPTAPAPTTSFACIALYASWHNRPHSSVASSLSCLHNLQGMAAGARRYSHCKVPELNVVP